MSGTTATHSDNERLTRNDILRKFKKKTPMQEIMIRFLRNRMAVVGIIIFAAILLLAIFADVIADYETVALKMNIPERLQAPSAAHWLGTDDSGRDVFARIIHGARTSLWIGFVATAFSLLLGGALGAIAGYVGGWLDELIMRIMDVFYAFPSVLLAISLSGAMGAGTENTLLSLTLVFIPPICRVSESVTTQVRGFDFVDAAKASGASAFTIVRVHVLGNVLGPILVYATSLISVAIILAAGLSFLGLGVKPPEPEWGLMLNTLRQAIYVNPVLAALPGVMIFVTSICFNLMSDGLRAAMDVKA